MPLLADGTQHTILLALSLSLSPSLPPPPLTHSHNLLGKRTNSPPPAKPFQDPQAEAGAFNGAWGGVKELGWGTERGEGGRETVGRGRFADDK